MGSCVLVVADGVLGEACLFAFQCQVKIFLIELNICDLITTKCVDINIMHLLPICICSKPRCVITHRNHSFVYVSILIPPPQHTHDYTGVHV